MISDDIEARSNFLALLDWLVAVEDRYGFPIDFGLIYIEYGENNELGIEYGAQEAVHQLDELRRHLKRAFRKTDLVARNGSDIWVIVPYEASTEKIYEKVVEILTAVEHAHLRVVNPEIAIFNLVEHSKALGDQVTEFNALTLLAHLKENKISLAQEIFCLYPKGSLT